MRVASTRVRGEIHPGLVAAGLVLALGLAWWFARPGDLLRDSAVGDVPATTQSPGRPSVTAPAANASSGSAESAAKPLYRWTDASGVVHFTDVAPADRPFTVVDVNPERNVVQSRDARAATEP